MRITGLEPARVASLEPKSSASANFAISANKKSLWFLLGEGTRGVAITAFIHTLLFYVLFLKKSTVKTNLCKEKKPIPPIIGWNGFFMNQEGFEPPTHGLEGRCSIQLSYRLKLYRNSIKLKSGWWESNPRDQLGRLEFYHWTTPAYNRGDRIRTCDLLIPNQAL